MAEVMVQFDTPVQDDDGRAWRPRACGRETDGGHWEGWIEFEPLSADGGAVLRTPRESRQPNRSHLEYWAGGLTAVYLEGALRRAAPPRLPHIGPRSVAVLPAYDGPAPAAQERDVHSGGSVAARAAEATRTRPRSILDPFKVFVQGEDVLLAELRALSETHLRSIIREHDLVGEEEVDLQSMRRQALAELIVAAVRRRVG